MRTFAKYLLAVSGALLAFIALSGTSVWLLMGTADHATSTVMSVLAEDLAGRAAGSAVIDSLAGDANPVVKARLESEAAPLSQAAAVGLRASEDAISVAIHAVYGAVEEGAKIAVDIKPVASRVLVEIHKVDAAIPADPNDVADASGGGERLTLDVDGSGLGLIRTALTLVGAWWVLLLGALALLVLAGVCDRRGPVRRWRVTGICLAVPSAVLLIGSFAAGTAVSGVVSSDTNNSVLVSAAISVAQATMVRLAGIALILAIALIIVTIVVKPGAKQTPG